MPAVNQFYGQRCNKKIEIKIFGVETIIKTKVETLGNAMFTDFLRFLILDCVFHYFVFMLYTDSARFN